MFLHCCSVIVVCWKTSSHLTRSVYGICNNHFEIKMITEEIVHFDLLYRIAGFVFD